MQFELYCLFYLLFSHWIADFVIQGGDVIEGHADARYIHMHCLRYALFFPSASVIAALFLGASITQFAVFSLINVVSHYAIDYFAIPCASAFFRERRAKQGLCALALDQLLHTMIVIFSFVLILR